MLVTRFSTPSDAVPVIFESQTDPTMSIINLGRVQEGINELINPHDIVTNERDITLHFLPLYDYSLTRTVHSDSGFTVERLVNEIVSSAVTGITLLSELDNSNQYDPSIYTYWDLVCFPPTNVSGISISGTHIYADVES